MSRSNKTYLLTAKTMLPTVPHVGGDVGVEVWVTVVQRLGQAEKETSQTTQQSSRLGRN